MATQEAITQFNPEEQLIEAPAPTIEALQLPDQAPIPAAEFVIKALRESVDSGAMTNVLAAEKYNNWDPQHPVHPGHFI